ncbi:hypothetical protein ACGFIF_13045 [Kribbella sp. NPDC049174]|uniref:hypothetical protein n=1 Tax=Kribbella sp. NPDC049174 TaxID=3364112 RepID=UPI003718EE50
MPKLKLGAVAYALVAIGLLASAVMVLRQVGPYAGVHGWPLVATAVVDALSGLLFAVGAVTRRGLIADDGPWICRSGWVLLVGLTAAGALVAFLSDQELSPWPTGPAVFLPHFIRRLQESYYDGRSEGERELEIRAAVRGEEPPLAR